ncbi:MAG: NUDIX domain-containing protein [Actinomycetota bacterium]
MTRVCVALAVFTVRGQRLEALLVRRPGNVWTLPSAEVGDHVRLEDLAHAALQSQTGVTGIAIEQLYTFDTTPGAVTVAYLALIAAGRHPLAPGPDAVEVRWFAVDDAPPLAPDHAEVLAYGQARLRAKTAYAPIAFQLLPDAFTLSELQAVYEAVLGARLDTRNFRRDVLAAGVVEPVGRRRAEGPGRPAGLYRSVGGDFAVVARERRVARAIAEGVHPEASPTRRHPGA